VDWYKLDEFIEQDYAWSAGYGGDETYVPSETYWYYIGTNAIPWPWWPQGDTNPAHWIWTGPGPRPELEDYYYFWTATNYIPEIPRTKLMIYTDSVILDSVGAYLDMTKAGNDGKLNPRNDTIWVYRGDSELGKDCRSNVMWRSLSEYEAKDLQYVWTIDGCYEYDSGGIITPTNRPKELLLNTEYGVHPFWSPTCRTFSDRSGHYLPRMAATTLVERVNAGTNLVRRLVSRYKDAYANEKLAGLPVKFSPITKTYLGYQDPGHFNDFSYTVVQNAVTNSTYYPGLTCSTPTTDTVDLAEYTYTVLREDKLETSGFTSNFWWFETVNTSTVVRLTNFTWLAKMGQSVNLFEYKDDAPFPYYHMSLDGGDSVYCFPILETLSVGSYSALAAQYHWAPNSAWQTNPPKHQLASTWFLINDKLGGLTLVSNCTSKALFLAATNLPYKVEDLPFTPRSVYWPKPTSQFYKPAPQWTGPSGYYARGGVIKPTAYTVGLVAKDQLRFYASFYNSRAYTHPDA
jgi:hypothetical protein